jgi:hypothetical protein
VQFIPEYKDRRRYSAARQNRLTTCGQTTKVGQAGPALQRCIGGKI